MPLQLGARVDTAPGAPSFPFLSLSLVLLLPLAALVTYRRHPKLFNSRYAYRLAIAQLAPVAEPEWTADDVEPHGEAEMTPFHNPFPRTVP